MDPSSMMGVPEGKLFSRSRKGSKLCLNSTRMKDNPGEKIVSSDSAPSSPQLRKDNDKCSFIPYSDINSSQTGASEYVFADNSQDPLVAPVSSFYNLGNTCFMNCMLHVLRFTPDFVPLLGRLREEIDMEEKLSNSQDTPIGNCQARVGWQLLRSLHDLYEDMSGKEGRYEQHLPTSTSSMAVRPRALLDNVRSFNPLFEGNMQHDAQELLRCLLCGLDDAEVELRKVRQERVKQETEEDSKSKGTNLCPGALLDSARRAVSVLSVSPNPSSSSSSSTSTTTTTTTGSVVEKLSKVKQTAALLNLKGGRRNTRRNHRQQRSNGQQASKGIMASFLKVKEAPAVVTRLEPPQEVQEPTEGSSQAGDLDSCIATTLSLAGRGEAIGTTATLLGGDEAIDTALAGGDGSQSPPGVDFEGSRTRTQEEHRVCEGEEEDKANGTSLSSLARLPGSSSKILRMSERSSEKMPERSSSPISVGSSNADVSDVSDDIIFCGQSVGSVGSVGTGRKGLSDEAPEIMVVDQPLNKKSSLSSPSSVSSSTRSPVHQDCCPVSVKDSEGQRSRLGVRGRARKVFPPFVSNSSDDQQPPAPPPAEGTSAASGYGDHPCSHISDGGDEAAKRISRISSQQNVPAAKLAQANGANEANYATSDDHHLGKLTRECATTNVSHSKLHRAEIDEIIELPAALCDVVQNNKNNQKPSASSLVSQSLQSEGWNKAFSSPGRRSRAKSMEEERLVSEGGSLIGSPKVSLTPGQELVIHSPLLMKPPPFYTPPPSRSSGGFPASFPARLGNCLPPVSAKRALSFSSTPDGTAVTRLLPSSSSSPLEDGASLPQSQKHETAAPDKLSMFCDQESIYQARVRLRRCDWLGVSPVKSVSAARVLRQILQRQEHRHRLVVEKVMKVKKEEMDENGGKKALSDVKTPRKRSRIGDYFFPSGKASPAIKTDDGGAWINDLTSSTVESDIELKQSSRAKRLKKSCASRQKDNEDCEETSKLVTSVDISKLPKFSIDLEKCDWLMRSGQTSVKLDPSSTSSANKKVKICKQEGEENWEVPASSPHRPNMRVCAKVKGQPSSKSSSSADDRPPPTARLAHHLFGGTMSHQTRCCECESISQRSEEFLDISIPVPRSAATSGNHSDDESTSSSEDPAALILESLASREKIFGENKYFCENCHHLVEADRSCHVTSLPKVLALHLKRFHASSSAFGGVAKTNDHVDIPARIPCLLDSCALARTPSSCTHGYALYAVVTHSGASIRHGHYRTYVRTPHTFKGSLAKFKRCEGQTANEMKEPTSSPCRLADVRTQMPCDSNSAALGDEASSSSHLKDSNSVGEVAHKCSSHNNDIGRTTKANDPSSSSSSSAFVFPPTNSSREKEDSDESIESQAWWIECDDDFIQVFNQEEFYGKLSQTDSYLLGTPYILFYHLQES